MGKIHISSRCFSIEDQNNFASFSGDYNPIHVDAVAARRTLFGEPIVHGIASLLWAIEELSKQIGTVPSEIKAKFQKPIPLDEEVHCYWVQKERLLQITSARYQKFCMIEYSKIEQLEKKAIDKPVTETRTAKNPTLSEMFLTVKCQNKESVCWKHSIRQRIISQYEQTTR